MAEENGRGVALAILGIVAVIAIVGLVLLFSGAKKTAQVATGLDKEYGGSLKDVEYPYLEGRSVGGSPVTPEGVRRSDEQKAYAEGVPYRTFSRVPDQIPTPQTTCGEGFFEVAVQSKDRVEATTNIKCSDYVAAIDAYCCPIPAVRTK